MLYFWQMTNTRLELTLKGINENSIFLIQNLAAVLFKFICKTETNEKQDIKQLCSWQSSKLSDQSAEGQQ